MLSSVLFLAKLAEACGVSIWFQNRVSSFTLRALHLQKISTVLEANLIPDRRLETKRPGTFSGPGLSRFYPFQDLLGAGMPPIGWGLLLVRAAQHEMEARADRCHGGAIPLGFELPGRFR